MKIAVVPFRHPLFVRIILPSILILTCAALTSHAFAQSGSANTATAATIEARIERARALAAAHQLSAAATELESLRNSVQDDVLRNVTSVMLMNICLEEGNYPRAESLLEEAFSSRQVRNDATLRAYFALAGQAVNGARSHLARYRTFGINVSDASLPSEALNDLERLRSLLERMNAQAKEIIKREPKAYESLALLEDILGIRLSLARNEEDRAKWEIEHAGVRLALASPQTRIASVSSTAEVLTSIQNAAPAPSENSVAANSNQSAETNTVSTGSLNPWATRRIVPVYPQVAKNASTQGTVRVYVTVDEKGNVSDIDKSEGPSLLRGAAEDAARQWKFSPTSVSGKPVRLTGYIEFNFTL